MMLPDNCRMLVGTLACASPAENLPKRAECVKDHRGQYDDNEEEKPGSLIRR